MSHLPSFSIPLRTSSLSFLTECQNCFGMIKARTQECVYFLHQNRTLPTLLGPFHESLQYLWPVGKARTRSRARNMTSFSLLDSGSFPSPTAVVCPQELLRFWPPSQKQPVLFSLKSALAIAYYTHQLSKPAHRSYKGKLGVLCSWND